MSGKNEKWTGETANSDPDNLPQATNDGSEESPFEQISISEDDKGDDRYYFSTTTLLENDKGGAAKHLYEVFNSTAGALLATDGDTISWDANGKFDYLGEGEHAIDQFDYTIRLANGATSTATVTLKVNGVNDAASISGTATGTVTEDGDVQTANGTLTVTDADAGEAAFGDIGVLEGDYGTFSFDETTGEWGYMLNNDDPDLEELDEGEVAYDTLHVTSLDGTSSEEISVAVHGMNDRVATPGLMGKEVEIQWLAPDKDTPSNRSDNGTYIIDDGIEAAVVWEIDIDNDTIRIDFPGPSSYGFGTSDFMGYRFSDMNDEITEIIDVDVTFNSFTNFDESDVTYDDEHVWVNLAGTGFPPNGYINIDLTFA